ncbi:sister chromatid cohesion 1 protein 1 [Tanacetum coccineum]
MLIVSKSALFLHTATCGFHSGDGVKNAASSGSEYGFVSHGSDLNFGREFSHHRRSGSSLPPVAEEFPWDHPDPNYKLTELNKNDLLENDLMVETRPTQTQKFPSSDQPLEHLTHSIRMQLKSYFDTPGSAQTESLNQLALGLDRKRPACLFYQTCADRVARQRYCERLDSFITWHSDLSSRYLHQQHFDHAGFDGTTYTHMADSGVSFGCVPHLS